MNEDLGLRTRIHPAHIVTEEASIAWKLYRAFFAGGLAPGSLPFAGGYAEQPACVLASFDVLAEAEADMKPKTKTRSE